MAEIAKWCEFCRLSWATRSFVGKSELVRYICNDCYEAFVKEGERRGQALPEFSYLPPFVRPTPAPVPVPTPYYNRAPKPPVCLEQWSHVPEWSTKQQYARHILASEIESHYRSAYLADFHKIQRQAA